MKRVYICAPLGGNTEENLKRVRMYTEYALRCGVSPVVPHFYAECLDDAKPAEREMGISAGLALLWFCDEMWVFGDTVTGGINHQAQRKHLSTVSYHIGTSEAANSEQLHLL